MAITSGFFNAVNKDRTYDAEQVGSLFNGIITDGILEAVGDHLRVTSDSGMNINVGSGKAWLNGTWTNNDDEFTLHLDDGDTQPRIDAVVLEVNKSDGVRSNSVKIVKGKPSQEPVSPNLLKSDSSRIYQYALAYVTVPANANSITQSAISNGELAYCTAPLKSISLSDLVTNYTAQFTEWFNAIKGTIGEDAATRLGQAITELEKRVDRENKYRDKRIERNYNAATFSYNDINIETARAKAIGFKVERLGRIFLNMKITLKTNLGANDYWGMDIPVPAPYKSDYAILGCKKINKLGGDDKLKAYVKDGKISISTELTLNTGDEIAITGCYITEQFRNCERIFDLIA